MDAQLKAKWIAALRSGEYSQTTGTLKDDSGYCCLGVLCVVAGREITSEHDYNWINNTIGDNTKENFVQMNDREKKTFAEIATYIEESDL